MDENNLLLTKTQDELKPTITQLIKEQVSYDPFKDNDYLEQGSFLLNKFSQAKKTIEDQRLAFTKPLNESLKKINTFFKTFSEPIEQADKELREKLAKHRRELEYKRLEEQMKIEEENKRLAEEAEESGKPAVVLHTEIPELNKKIGAVVMKKVWTFQIDDQTKIPQEYLVVDEVKIRTAIRTGIRQIPGITIYQKDEVSL